MPPSVVAIRVLLVVRRHDDGDALALEHRLRARRRDMPAATPSHISAAIAPRMRPISAATTTELRRLRAVTRCAAAPGEDRRLLDLLRLEQELRSCCSWSCCAGASRIWSDELVGGDETAALSSAVVDQRDLAARRSRSAR